MKKNNFYREKYRPQFHFTAKKGWLNDPTGLVFYEGEYHLFYQYDTSVKGRPGKNMRWGHAVSRDLVRWKELPIALKLSKKSGQNYSGSSIVDYKNISGLGEKGKHPILLFFTKVKKNSFSQCLAFSNNKGRSWRRYADNPIIREIKKGNRDPRVFWHLETKKWIMVLWLKDGFTFFSSDNLKSWKRESSVSGFYECPDIFSLSVKKTRAEKKWVLVNGNGDYKIGFFDGKSFKPETKMLPGDCGEQLYATQTWNNTPCERKIQLAWMRGGKYPSMPFNQQMSFPCELALRKFPEGLRLCRTPVKELKFMRAEAYSRKNIALTPGKAYHTGIYSGALDVFVEIAVNGEAELEIHFYGKKIRYNAGENKISALGKSARLPAPDNKIKLRILIDRTSMELFCNEGFVSISKCFLPKTETTQVSFFIKKGGIQLQKLVISKLKSIWF